ncbi:MAG: glycoside hydrolase family 88 protein [Firmicutes bacterium]|nr:glycoside hydrolase family 88 protein [Bacillota bacterium]
MCRWSQDTEQKIIDKMNAVEKRSRDKIPYTSKNGVFDDHTDDITWWTNGFWPGLMWIMYLTSGGENFKSAARIAEKKLDCAFKKYDELHHDVGFMWHISSGADFRITKNNDSRLRTLRAADVIAARFNVKGNFIRAWNNWGNEDHTGWTIIDCMMNLPLLYWASEETKDPRYKYIAMAHADSTMKNHVRADGSVKHIVIYDPVSGEVIDEDRGQGYAKGSSWSRGQAWALYGFTLSWHYTKKQEYLDTAKRVANYFISCVCDDWLPKCDFRSPKEPVIYDSTAGAAAASGLIDLAYAVGGFEKNTYLEAALNLLKALDKNFCDYSCDTDSMVNMGTERYHSDVGRHIPIIYGDYYFAEAIYKLNNENYFHMF